MAILTRDGNSDPSYLTGKVREIPLSYDYTAPISDARRAFVEQVLRDNFPDRQFKIIGSLWNYDDPRAPKDNERQSSNIGHYRFRFAEEEGSFILCVGKYEREEALELGCGFFDEVDKIIVEEGKRRLNIVFPGKFPSRSSSKFHDSAKEYSVRCDENHVAHIEEYFDDTKWLLAGMNSKYGAPLGAMVGCLWKAGQKGNMSADLWARLESFGNDTMYKYCRAGLDAMNANAEDAEKLAAQFKLEAEAVRQVVAQVQAAMTPEIRQSVLARAQMVMKNDAMPGHGNVIEKMVWYDDEGNLFLAGCDAPSVGFLPKMTPNTSYDFGTAVYRIILNEGIYSVQNSSRTRLCMGAALWGFVHGYNAETGLKVEHEEALDSARNAFALISLYIIGNYLQTLQNQGPGQVLDVGYLADMKAHLDTTFKTAVATIEQINRLAADMDVSPGGPTPER